MTPWLAMGSHHCSTGTAGSPLALATGAALVLGKARIGQEAVAPGSCSSRRAEAGLGKGAFS